MIEAIGPVGRADVKDSTFAFGEAAHDGVVVGTYATTRPLNAAPSHRGSASRNGGHWCWSQIRLGL